MKSMACSIEGCEREIYCKTMCRPHYRRNKKYGDPLYVKADIEKPVAECSIPECGKPVRTYGWCYAHYMKNWRYGTPTPEHGPKWDDVRGQRFGTLVIIEREGQRWKCQCDCGVVVAKRAGDLNKYGDGSSCGDRRKHWRTNDCGYSSAHDRVRTDRGTVAMYDCIDCGRQAQHWCYNHEDPDERSEMVGGYVVTFSLNPDNYDPRCISCHKKFDMTFYVRTHCREGHELAGENLYVGNDGARICRTCQKRKRKIAYQKQKAERQHVKPTRRVMSRG